MPSILIDGKLADDLQPADSANVSDVFEQIRVSVLNGGRIIVEVSVDDQQLVWGDGSPLWEKPIAQIQSLRIQTDVALRLTLNLLEQMKLQMPPFASAHRDAAEMLRQGDQKLGLDRTGEIIPLWKDIQEGMTQICLLHGVDEAHPLWNDFAEVLVPLAESLTSNLNQLRDSIAAQDFVLTADLLEYEMAPLAERWQEACERVGTLLQERFSQEGT